MELQVYDINGKATRKVKVSDAVFGAELNEHVLHTVVKAYRANRRQGTHATKTKSMVSGGGKKPYKQKGTGNARQGSSRAAQFVGGGTAHGPQPRNYRQGINRKTKQLALKVALSDRVRHGQLFVVEDFSISNYSTKHVTSMMKSFKTEKALLLDERKDDFLYRSSRNINGAQAVQPAEVNAENVLRYNSLIVSETALKALEQRFEEGAQ